MFKALRVCCRLAWCSSFGQLVAARMVVVWGETRHLYASLVMINSSGYRQVSRKLGWELVVDKGPDWEVQAWRLKALMYRVTWQ